MKKILFTLLLTMPVLLLAQNYNNICSSGPTFFKKKNTTIVKAVKSTSFSIPVVGDTIFNTFRAIRDTAAECLDTTKGSIFGKKVYSAQDGIFYFFNKVNDTVYLHTKAQLNDTWKLVNISTTTFLEAKVVSVGSDSVISVIDEVKKVEITAKRNDGTVLSSPWNGKYFKMSKKYGLSETFDMVNVPYDTTKYILVGKLKPVIGIQDYGWKDVYNFNIGDAFHYSGYLNSVSSGQNTTWKEIQTVFSKTTYGANNDSVVYRIDRCKSTLTQPGNNHVYIHDTLNVKYRFTALANDSTIWRYPDQFARKNIYASQYDRYMKTYNNRVTKRVGDDKYRFINSCFTVPVGGVTLTLGYTEGLGLSEYFRYDSESNEYNKLVYFKKGTESWGAPVGYECTPYLSINEQPQLITTRVRLVPNPMKSSAEIMLEGIGNPDGLRFALFNAVGKKVYSCDITSNPMTLQKNDLPSGLYIWMIDGKSIHEKGKLVIE